MVFRVGADASWSRFALRVLRLGNLLVFKAALDAFILRRDSTLLTVTSNELVI